MLDAILINPSLFKQDKNIWKEIDSCFPAIGLSAIAAYIRQQGFKVKIIDAPALRLSVESFDKYLKDNYSQEPPRYVGFTAVTSAVKNAYAMAKIVRQIFPQAKIVFGGVHPTVLPAEVINQPEVDIVVKGEGELTFTEILAGRELAEIKGIVYKTDGQVMDNPARERIDNLDQLPFPAYDLLPMDKYYPAQGSYERLPAISMLTTRGCPGRCTFCNKTLGSRIVFRSAGSLVEEIKKLVKDFGIRQIMFYDDTFTVHKENVRQFCQLLLDQKIDITWCCFSRVDFIDLDLLKLMKQAGCHQIMYGIESGDQAVLDSINKNIKLDQIREVIKLTKQAGIDIRGAFMIGSPMETKETVLRTLNFAIELNPEIVIFNITTPYPGSQMFDQVKAQGLLMSEDWDDYDLSKPVMRLENLTQTEILKLYRYCYRKFYFRWQYILMRLKRLFKKPEEIKLVLSPLRAVFSFLKR
ncbi:MAG: radical SAM protein [bacterium]